MKQQMTILPQVILCQINIFRQKETQNMTTEFVGFTRSTYHPIRSKDHCDFSNTGGPYLLANFEY